MGLSLFSLQDRVAIVTGSGGGIGRGIALEFAEAGADLVIAGINIYDQSRTEADLEAVAKEVRSRGRKALTVPADVRQNEDVETLVQKAVKKFGKIDILVNNVGGTFYAPLLETKWTGWEAVFRENLKTAFLCSQAVAKVMIEQKRSGCFINIASVAAWQSSPDLAHYGAAKAAVVSFTKSLAVALAPYHIRVNAIAPGFIEHEGHARVQSSQRPHRSEEERVKLISTTLVGRSGRPQDIAAAAVYLASDAASYVAGFTLVVDGGIMAGTGFIHI